MKWYTTDVKPEENDLIIMRFDHAIPYLRSNQRYELGYYQKEFSFSTFLSWITQESLVLSEEDIACWAKIEEPKIIRGAYNEAMVNTIKSNAGHVFTLFPKEESESVKTYSSMKEVTKEEFYEFLHSYPRPLETDFYMDWYSWNDFTLGDHKWPDSIVAMCSDGAYDAPITYKILEELCT